ncbi:methylmalonyl-CoA mutase family protein [Leptospira sp. 96542]|nr:methylmalonyl-CoA mutase family protein [Leptospira sp. 96542]
MNEPLFKDFPEVSTEEWKNLILKDLKGQPWEKVSTISEEGFTIQPFYRKENLPPKLPKIEKRFPGWKITELVYEPKDLDGLNTKGADAFILTSPSQKGSNSGFHFESPKDLTKLADKLPKLPFVVSLGETSPKFLDELKILSNSHEIVLCDYDPYGTLLLNGSLQSGLESVNTDLKSIADVKGLVGNCIHSHYLRDAGASVGGELKYSLSWAVDYLNRLVEAGSPIEGAANSIWFWMGIGSDYFLEIAKFRAIRILWAEILNAYQKGLGDKVQPIVLAQTTEFNFTAYDPHVNLLRGTTAAMSAVLGGADFVAVQSFDRAYPQTQELGKRMARNTQLLLRHESFLDKVEDPSSGSYYLEVLTHELCQSAWGGFQILEAEGGFFQAIQSGSVQSAVLKRLEEKKQALATKKEVLLGTNQYPLVTERHPELKTSLNSVKQELDAKKSTKTPFQTIQPIRLSYDFDRLRNQTDEHIQSGKKPPKVFLLTIGDLSMRKARAGFTQNFVGCLGYEIIDNLGFSSVKEGVEKAKALGAEIVVLCSSDEEYQNYLPDFVSEMKEQLPNSWKLIAGYPKDLVTKATELGIEDFIHMKRNIIEFMEKAQSKWLGK